MEKTSNSPLSVLQLGPVPPPHGGVAANMIAIRDYLRARGHSAGLVNLTRHRQAERDEIWYPHSIAGVLRLIHTLPYRILHLHVGGDLPARVVALCLAVASVPGKRSVFTFHSGGYPSSPVGRAASPASSRGFVMRRFDRIISVNQELIDMFRRFGVPAEQLRLILPFALPAQVPPGPLPEPLESFFAAHSPVVLSIGQLEPEYDLARQIDAFEAVRRRHPSAGLAILGSGSLDTSLRAALAAKPYHGHVLICGDVNHDAALKAIARSGLLWRTTLYDGDAISVREALHLGLPVVATENRMRPAGTLIVPIGDTPALLEATWKGLDPAARAHPRPPSQTTDNMAQTLALYQELL